MCQLGFVPSTQSIEFDGSGITLMKVSHDLAAFGEDRAKSLFFRIAPFTAKLSV